MNTPSEISEKTTAISPDPSVYVYASAGIGERKGSVPLWLWGVVVSLLIWGAYYLVTYWNAPVP